MCLLAGKGLINSFCFLSRYALARNIWMEILLKLAAVALVTLIEVVRNEAVVKLCLGVTVGTAAIISLAQPYSQPQINRLQCICFICLSATAVGFAFNQRWLSRAALCLPFVFAAWQLRRHRDGKGERVKGWQQNRFVRKMAKSSFRRVFQIISVCLFIGRHHKTISFKLDTCSTCHALATSRLIKKGTLVIVDCKFHHKGYTPKKIISEVLGFRLLCIF